MTLKTRHRLTITLCPTGFRIVHWCMHFTKILFIASNRLSKVLQKSFEIWTIFCWQIFFGHYCSSDTSAQRLSNISVRSAHCSETPIYFYKILAYNWFFETKCARFNVIFEEIIIFQKRNYQVRALYLRNALKYHKNLWTKIGILPQCVAAWQRISFGMACPRVERLYIKD